MAKKRLLGGGRLYFERYNGTDYDPKIEIGEVKKATLKVAVTYKEAYVKDDGVQKKVEKVPVETGASFNYTTQNVNVENVAMAMMGIVGTESFDVGDTLPDGSTATEAIDIPVIRGGAETKVEGRLTFVGKNIASGDHPVCLMHHVVTTPAGDARDYYADDFNNVGFENEIIKLDTENELFKEYFMPKA